MTEILNLGEYPMTTITTAIDIKVPVQTAYNQWTQFEKFPAFMEGIVEVHQLDDTHLHWKAVLGGLEKEWDAVITEQIPDERITWKSTSGSINKGSVMFEPLSDEQSRVQLTIAYEPEGVIETVGDGIGTVSVRVKEDLNRFKDFIESQSAETGAWRGKI